jgi:hypothetical protein
MHHNHDYFKSIVTINVTNSFHLANDFNILTKIATGKSCQRFTHDIDQISRRQIKIAVISAHDKVQRFQHISKPCIDQDGSKTDKNTLPNTPFHLKQMLATENSITITCIFKRALHHYVLQNFMLCLVHSESSWIQVNNEI